MHLDLLTFVWAAGALIAIVIELHSQTVYLLALAAAAATAAVLDLLGARLEWQMVVFAGVCLAGFPLAAWARHRLGRQPALGAADIGLEATVLSVGPRGLRVRYRGSEWDAVLVGGGAAPGDALRILGMRGSTLELKGGNQ